MAQIPAEGLSHYTVEYGPNCAKLKAKAVGHWSVYRKNMEDCFSDTHTFGAGYKRAKGYCREGINVPDTPTVNEV